MTKQSSSALVLARDKTALVVVDMQNAFLSENGSAARAGNDISRLKTAIAPIRRLLERFRALGMPVIFTQMALHPDYRDAGLLSEANPALRELGHAVRGTWDWEIVPELAPQKGEWMVEKSRFSGFYNTNLEIILRGLKVETVVIVGVATNVCVESTVRDAFFRDFKVLLPRDATACSSREVEEASLLSLGRLFMQVTTTDAVLSALEGCHESSRILQSRFGGIRMHFGPL
jgi:ureidoacrylate peracid hydrolase